jgi:NAD(P)-dependent dehydrogenase (short-subunit alcohol dehydrogenase family)
MTNGNLRLTGQVVVVTGGASGIGRACARMAAAEGASVVVVDVSRERIDDTLAGMEGERHLGLVLDVRAERDMEEMARVTLERHGRIDALLACAGILRGRGSSPKPLVQISAQEWDEVLSTNLTGIFLSNRAVLPAMIRQRRGNIVNVSSVSGKQGRAHDAPYCASKFGVIGLSEALAEEVRSQGVRVQVVMPDAVDTPIWEQNGPVPRPPNALAPDRVADLLLFLITQPDDMVLLGTVIAPFRTRRRIGAKNAGQTELGTAAADR